MFESQKLPEMTLQFCAEGTVFDMRVSFCLALALCGLLALSACGKSVNTADGAGEDSKYTYTESTDGKILVSPKEKEEHKEDPQMFTDIADMVQNPADYEGKTVKITGTFAVMEGEQEGEYYFGCLVKNGDGDLTQGLEFVLSGEHAYPEDYPQEGAEITVEGVFETYIEGDKLFCRLTDASMTEGA